jgi:hypothetical protein
MEVRQLTGWPSMQTGISTAQLKRAGDLSLCTGLGCGVVFRLAPDSDGGWKETVLHRFLDHPGARPANGTLIFDSAGNIYDTTAGDPTATVGSVFEITP